MQHHQNAGNVEVQVFAKKLNAKPERVAVDIAQQHLKVEIKDEECNEVEYTFDEDLYQEVDVDASNFKVLSTQVLIKMKKKDGSISWPTLGKSEAPVRSRDISNLLCCHFVACAFAAPTCIPQLRFALLAHLRAACLCGSSNADNRQQTTAAHRASRTAPLHTLSPPRMQKPPANTAHKPACARRR